MDSSNEDRIDPDSGSDGFRDLSMLTCNAAKTDCLIFFFFSYLDDTEMLNIQRINSLTIIEEHCLILAFL